MKEFSHSDVWNCVLKCCSIPRDEITLEKFQNVTALIGAMHGAGSVWSKPNEVETQLEAVRSKLFDAMEAIRGMDNYAKSLARREADKGSFSDLGRLVLELSNSEMDEEQRKIKMEKLSETWKPQPKEQWVDYAALEAMEKLRASLVNPIEKLIQISPTGAGRPPNRRAYAVAEYAYLIFVELTEQKPGFWEGGKTPFSSLVEELYQIYGIRAGLKKPILAAMHKYERTS